MRELELGPRIKRKSYNLIDKFPFEQLDSPLLPNLRKLVCFESRMGRYLRSFLQSSLTELYWKYDNGPYTAPALDALREADPTLTTLHLLPHPAMSGTEGIAAAMKKTVQSMRHLQRGAVFPVEILLGPLSSLASLTHLRLEVPGGPVDHPSYFSLPSSAAKFCHLQELAILAPLDSYPRLSAFLDGISSRSLKALRLSFIPSSRDRHTNERDSRHIASSFRRVINSCSAFVTLELLMLGFEPNKPSRSVMLIEDSECFLSDDAITPLLRLRSLVTLDLQDLPLSMSPDGIARVLQNWPNMRALYLGSNSSDTVHTATTLGDLRLFVSCTKLEYLGFAVTQFARSHLDDFAASEGDDDDALPINPIVRRIYLRVFARPSGQDERYINSMLARVFPAAGVRITRGPRAVGY